MNTVLLLLIAFVSFGFGLLAENLLFAISYYGAGVATSLTLLVLPPKSFDD